jgi:hypothetical protein
LTVRPPDRASFTRHHDGGAPPFIPDDQLRAHFYPSSINEVTEYVRDAAGEPKPFIRAAGSHWSLSEAVVDPLYEGRIVETHGLSATLFDVIPDAVTREVLDDLTRQPAADPGRWDEDAYNLFHVEAGIRIYELYSRLDDPSASLPTDPLGIAALAGPWGLPTLGGAGGQTLAGVISTATHGGDIRHPPIADAVVALHIVGAGGVHYWVQGERFSDRVAAPLTDEARLAKALGAGRDRRLKIVSDDEALDAALVTVGRFGVIYSVVLKVVRSYGLAETRVPSDWERVAQQLRNPSDPIHDHRFLQVVVNPLERWPFGGHGCWVTHHDAVPLPDRLPTEADRRNWRGREQRAGANAGASVAIDNRPGDFFDLICTTENVRPRLHELVTWARVTGFLAPPPIGGPPLPPGSGLAFVAADLIDGVLRATTSERLGDLVAEICNLAVAQNLGFLVQVMNESMLAAGQSPVPADDPLTDLYYAILDRFNYRDRACITNGDSLEVAFDASAGAHVDFVDGPLFDLTRRLLDGSLTGTPAAFGGYASMRFTARTRALLGIQKWDRTCIIEVAGLKSLSGMGTLLDALESAAKGMGATVHWGQRNNLIRSEVEAMYPSIERWRQWLRYCSGGGPIEQFSTSYTERAGLEP